jgi:hypothetical protein
LEPAGKLSPSTDSNAIDLGGVAVNRWGVVHFIILDLIACALVFGSALWGHCLLAPLDIAPALFSKYSYVAPNSSHIPANHYVIDQLTYDLPLQHTIYTSYRRAEVPWWDPYTWSGRPLLADAHINGTDPVRVTCYMLLPFELAYNWTRILHFFLSGLGMFLLLRHWRWNQWSCLLLALTYQFAGIYVMYFGHPWNQASFVYYPFLWLVWEAGLQRKCWRYMAGAGLLVAFIFYAGNLQSHSYLALFGTAFLIGYAGRTVAGGIKVATYLGLSLVLGACLAAPVLLGQVELFLLSQRGVTAGWRPLDMLGGLMALTGVYPWALGTYRSLDLGKISHSVGAGFYVYIGSAGFLLAMVGCYGKPNQEAYSRVRRVALVLLLIYFGLVMSTPLRNIFYMRSAGLAALGLIVLAGLGIEKLLENPKPMRRFGLAVLIFAVSIAIVTNAAALWLYPRLISRVSSLVDVYQSSQPGLSRSGELRQFQIRNLPKEVSFRNPETVLALVSMLGLGLFLAGSRWRKTPGAVLVLLGLNLIPVLLFSHRFIPNQPVELWRRLLIGGPEQQQIAGLLGGTPMRLLEQAPTQLDQVFPMTLSHLWRVRTVHGYAALQPNSLFLLPSNEQKQYAPQLADYVCETSEGTTAAGVLTKNSTPGLARFQWLHPTPRPFVVKDISLNEMRIEFDSGPGSILLWTDSYYPGWIAEANGQPVVLRRQPPCFTTIEVGTDVQVLTLRYRPRFLRLGQILAMCGLVGLVVASRKHSRALFQPCI